MGKKQKLRGKKVNPKKITPRPKKIVGKKKLSYKTGTKLYKKTLTPISRMKKTMKKMPKKKY